VGGGGGGGGGVVWVSENCDKEIGMIVREKRKKMGISLIMNKEWKGSLI